MLHDLVAVVGPRVDPRTAAGGAAESGSAAPRDRELSNVRRDGPGGPLNTRSYLECARKTDARRCYQDPHKNRIGIGRRGWNRLPTLCYASWTTGSEDRVSDSPEPDRLDRDRRCRTARGFPRTLVPLAFEDRRRHSAQPRLVCKPGSALESARLHRRSGRALMAPPIWMRQVLRKLSRSFAGGLFLARTEAQIAALRISSFAPSGTEKSWAADARASGASRLFRG